MIDRRRLSLQDRVEIYSALRNETRLIILEHLSKNNTGTICVNEIATLLGVTAATASTHIIILKKAGLVETHKNGKKTLILLIPDTFIKLHNQIGEFVDNFKK